MGKTFIFLGGPAAYGADDKRECWMPKGDVPYFDPVMRQRFDSRSQKRAYLKRHGMRECGELINPSQHLEGRNKSKPRPQTEAIQRHIQSSGGTNGLLDRIQRGQGQFL
jgi:hypothetical protein